MGPISTLSLAEAYHAAQSFLTHIGLVLKRVEEPADGIIELEAEHVLARIRFDRAVVGQGAILALLKAAEGTPEPPILFSASGFTDSAAGFAENHAVALFHIEQDGAMTPYSSGARLLEPKEPFVPPFGAGPGTIAPELLQEPEHGPDPEEVAASNGEAEWIDCATCGTTLHPTANFCARCGETVDRTTLRAPRSSGGKQAGDRSLVTSPQAAASPAAQSRPVPAPQPGRPTLRCRTCGSHDIELVEG
jgi:hypothetical protein